MSFDITVGTGACAHCGSSGTTVWGVNITHNVNGIAELCLCEAGAPEGKQDYGYKTRSWGRLHGWQCSEVVEVLARALEIATDPARESDLRAMEPSNKWGSLESVRTVLRDLHAAAVAHPKAFIEAHG